MMRGYATVISKAPSRLQRRGKNPVSLDHFIQRQRSLALWREILRCTASITDPGTKKDMRQFARTEFEQHRDVSDLGHIRYLISSGKTQFDAMKSSLFNAGLLS